MIRVIRLFLAMFIFSSLALTQNTKNTITTDEAGRSILRLFTVCEYKIVLKNPKDKEIKISITMIGNGFFAGKHNGGEELIVTASHLFECNSSIGEIASSGILKNLDNAHKEDMSVENIVAMKDGKIVQLTAYTLDGIISHDVKILFNTPVPKIISDPDSALLKVVFLQVINHSHFLLMDDKIFDEIFYKESIIGREVVAKGFLLFNNGWFLRYRNAKIEWTRQEIFQINEALDHGLSGGPILFEYEGKIYAVGIVSSGPAQQEFRVLDMSWISIVKNSFLNNRNKK